MLAIRGQDWQGDRVVADAKLLGSADIAGFIAVQDSPERRSGLWRRLLGSRR